MRRKPFDPVDGPDVESLRRELVSRVNSTVSSRSTLEATFGRVWDASELTAEFEVEAFLAPVACVRRRATGERGTLLFQHLPRFYWGWQKDECDNMA